MATQRITRYVRLVINASGAKSGGREVRRTLDEINRSVRRTEASLNGLSGAFSSLFAYIGVRELVQYADTWALISGRLEVATGSAAAAARAQQQVLDIANSARAPLSGAAELYARLAVSTRELGTTQDDIAKATEAVALSFRVGGASASEAAAASIQFAQGLASGALQGDELRSVLENNIPLAQIIAREFGVTVGQLRELGAEGQLTADRVLPAVIGALDELREQSETMPETIGGAFKVLQNEFTALVGRFTQSTGATDAVAKAILWLAENLDTVLVAMSALALRAIPAVMGGLRALGALFTASPVGRFVALISAAATAVYELTKQTVTYGGESARVGTIVSVVWDRVVSAIRTVLDWFAEMASAFRDRLSNMLDNAGISFEGIAGFARKAVNFIIAVGKSFVDYWIGYFRALQAAAFGVFEGIKSAASALGQGVKAALSGDIAAAAESFANIGSGFDFSGVEAEIAATAETIGANFGRDFVGEAGAIIDMGLRSIMAEAAERERLAGQVDTSPIDGGGGPLTAPGTPEIPSLGGGGGGGKSRAASIAEETASLANFHAELDRGIELARMFNAEREVEVELRRMLDELAKAGIAVSAQEADALREKIGLHRQLEQLQSNVLSAGEIMFKGFTDFMSGAADAIVEFGRTGKFEIRSLVSDIFAQMAKLALNSVFNQLFGNFLSGGGFGGLFGGGGGGLGALLGFAQGGSFEVGGGGGTDSKLVAFRASPGERVTVTRPDQAPPAAEQQPIRVVNVIDPRQALDALNTAQGERVILNTIERNPGAVRALLSR